MILVVLLICHNRGVWLKFNLTYFFTETIGRENLSQSLLVSPEICFRYSRLRKSGSLVINLSLIQSGSRSNQCCDLAYFPWNWYVCSDYSGLIVFFLPLFIWFTWTLVDCFVDRSKTLIIFIFILRIHSTLISLSLSSTEASFVTLVFRIERRIITTCEYNTP